MKVEDDNEDIENEVGMPPPSHLSNAETGVGGTSRTAGGLAPDLEARLLSLWARRAELDRNGVEELYLIAQPFLLMAGKHGKTKSLADALPYDLENSVNDFLAFKVFKSAGDGALDHARALPFYFQRFLISQLRKEHVPGNYGTGWGEGDDPDGIPLSVAFDRGCHEVDPAEILVKTLDEPMRVGVLALEFLRDCPVWGRLFLRFHDCADRNDGKMTRGTLAKSFGIPSYQQKAWKLGVVIPPERQIGGRLDTEWFAGKTLIGRWMRESVGMSIDADNQDSMLACIKILCQAALKHVDGKGELI